MKQRYITSMFLLIFITMPMLSAAEETAATTIRMLYTAQAGYQPAELQMLGEVFKEMTGITVKIDYSNYEEQYAKIIASAADYDVFALDQIWLADLVAQGILTPLDDYVTAKMRKDIAPEILKAFHYQRQMWVVPFLTDLQFLFYNVKTLEKAGFQAPPKTLEEMVAQMKTMKSKSIVKYPWTDAWKQGEELICEYVWLTGAFGGALFDKDGKPIFDQTAGLKALEFMAMLVKEQLVAPDIFTNDDLAAKDIFLRGDAAFTSNWLFLDGLIQHTDAPEIRAAVDMALLPTSQTNAQPAAGTAETTQPAMSSTVGSFQGLGISAASQQKDAAWKWIAFLTSPLTQRAFLHEMPIWLSVQSSPDTVLFDKTMPLKQQALQNMRYRPNIPKYPEISAILQQHLHAALEGKELPKDALTNAKTEIEKFIAAQPKE